MAVFQLNVGVFVAALAVFFTMRRCQAYRQRRQEQQMAQREQDVVMRSPIKRARARARSRSRQEDGTSASGTAKKLQPSLGAGSPLPRAPKEQRVVGSTAHAAPVGPGKLIRNDGSRWWFVDLWRFITLPIDTGGSCDAPAMATCCGWRCGVV